MHEHALVETSGMGHATRVERFVGSSPGTVAGVLANNVTQFRSIIIHHSKQVVERLNLYDVEEERDISTPIIFLETGDGSIPRGNLTRNGIHFNQPVLYVYVIGTLYYGDRPAPGSQLGSIGLNLVGVAALTPLTQSK